MKITFIGGGNMAQAIIGGLVGIVYAISAVPSLHLGNGAALGVMLVAFLMAVLLGLPVSFAMLLGSLMFLLISGVAPLIAAAQNTFDGTSNFILLTLPFFIWAGLIMEKGGISLRLVRFAMTLVGHMRGGLLLSLASFSGSVTLGSMCLPSMVHGKTSLTWCEFKPSMALRLLPLPALAVHHLVERPPIRAGERGERPVCRVAERDQEGAEAIVRIAEQAPRELLVGDGGVAAADA